MMTGRSGRGHGTVVGGALQGIDHLVRDVEHGRFERGLTGHVLDGGLTQNLGQGA